MAGENVEITAEKLSKLMTLTAVTRNMINDIYNVLSADLTAHPKKDCGCAVCKEIRSKITPIVTEAGKAIEKLEEAIKEE